MIRLVVNVAAFFFIAYVWPGQAHIQTIDMGHAVLAAIILGVVNAILRPILIILTLPAVILTLGLFTLVINAIVLWIVSKIPGLGLTIDSFLWAFLGALVLSIVSAILSHLVKPLEEEKKPLTKTT